MHMGLTEVSVLSSLCLCSPVALSLIGYLSGQVCWEQHLSPSLSPWGCCPVSCQPLNVKPHPWSMMYPGKDPRYIPPYPPSCNFSSAKGETMETVTDFILGGSKITADGDCSHEIKRCLLLAKKVKTNLDSILKNRDILLPTKVHLVKAMFFPVVMYGCESWTIKKAERQRIDVSELWCWRKLLRVPWTAKRSNQSILKEISPEYSLEGLMLKLKL